MEQEFLDFERPIAELEARINELRYTHTSTHINLAEEVKRLQKKRHKLTESIFADLTPAQIVQVARHPNRPYFKDYIPHLFDGFVELHGDRCFRDGRAIIGGMARFEGTPVMVIGQQKGREVKEKIHHNFGMPMPEGYRKANRLMKLAEKFNLPLLTFIDTPGAYPGVKAEEHNQSQAIAQNLFDLSDLDTPIICTVIGEGGSGGALAIGVGDRIFMLEYSIYSVISPEGCASILWKDAKESAKAAEALGLTAKQLYQQKLIDGIIPEPTGGAHRHLKETADAIRLTINQSLRDLRAMTSQTRLKQRYDRLMLSQHAQ